MNSHGVIRAAILTTNSFDATDVDPESVTFAGADAVRWAPADVDGDDDVDLLLFFRTRETDITFDDTEACLQGETFSGEPFMGCNSIRVVPPFGAGSGSPETLLDLRLRLGSWLEQADGI